MLRPFSSSLLSTPAADRVRAFLGKSDQNTQDEIAAAGRILAAAPTVGDPLDVTRYFESVEDVNADGWRYTQEWPDSRENPVIIAFFRRATRSCSPPRRFFNRRLTTSTPAPK